MYGLIEDVWERLSEQLAEIASRLCVGKDTPNDRLLVIFVAHKCGLIELSADESKYIDEMMYKNATTGHIEGNVTTILNNPDFVENFF